MSIVNAATANAMSLFFLAYWFLFIALNVAVIHVVL